MEKYQVTVWCINCTGKTLVCREVGERLPDKIICGVCVCETPTSKRSDVKIIKDKD
jgi:hypothetical protein